MEAPRWLWFIDWELPRAGHVYHVKRVLYRGRSQYQDIDVVELEYLGKALVLDGRIQSAEVDEYVYHEALVQPAMILHGRPERVLILGGGEGATAREALKFKTVKEVVMVDIDREVVEVAKRYLQEWHRGAFEDPRLKLVIADGYEYVRNNVGREKFDVIISDLVDPVEAGPAYKLYTREFYEMIKGLLNRGGVFVTQATSLSYLTRVHAIVRNTLASVFRHVASYSVFVKSFNDEWSFVLASDEKDPNALSGETVDRLLADLLVGENRFYDGMSHMRMFTLPRYARKVLEEERGVSTLEKPVSMPTK